MYKFNLWTKEGIDNEVITTYQYVFDLRNRIEDTCNVARENLLTAQRKYKKHFDKSARLRTLDIGERALVMLPTDHNKLLLRWKGPYQVVEKIGVCDYRIKIGNHNRLFHINMLKKYIDREPILCAVAAILDPMDCPELEINEMPEIGKETYLDVPISDEASRSTPVTVSAVDRGGSRMASPRDLSWLLCYSTCTYTTSR